MSDGGDPPDRPDRGQAGGTDGPPLRERSADDGARDPRLTIARRELASLRSEKTIVLALAIQLFVAAFSSFLVVGLVSLYDPDSVEGLSVRVGVAGNATGPVAGTVERRGMIAREYASRDNASDDFRAGQVDVVLIANRTPAGQFLVQGVVPQGNLRTTLYVVQTRDALQALERDLRVRYASEGRLDRSPLRVPDEGQSSPFFGFSYTVLIPLLMFLPVFISGSIAVDSVTEEIQRGTLELLRVAPVNLVTIVDAKLLSTATLAPLQAALWLALLSLNGTTVVRPGGLVVLVAGLSMAVVATAVGISLVAPDRRQAQFLYSTGVIGAAALAALLPEHPANTVAKLAVGSASTGTWLAVAAYTALGVAGYLVVRIAVERVDAEGL